MVEQEAVNFEVTGSSPVRGARFCTIMGYLAWSQAKRVSRRAGDGWMQNIAILATKFTKL